MTITSCELVTTFVIAIILLFLLWPTGVIKHFSRWTIRGLKSFNDSIIRQVETPVISHGGHATWRLIKYSFIALIMIGIFLPVRKIASSTTIVMCKEKKDSTKMATVATILNCGCK